MTKPTRIKELQGTLKPSRQLKNEMQPPEVESIETPKGLCNQFAVDEWMKQTGILATLGMLIETDTSLLLAYCNEMGKYFECQEIIKEEGLTFHTPNGHIMPRPEASEGNKALANAIKLSDKFGFNPAARTKIEMPEKKPVDPFAEL
jgi:P27 family predicted phage terminase small subunit